MTAIADRLAISTSTVIRKLNEFQFKTDLTWLPETMSWNQYAFRRYSRSVRKRVKVVTMDMFSPYYDIAKKLFPNAQIVRDRSPIILHMSRARKRVRIQIMNPFDRKSHEHKALKRYWKLIQIVHTT